ncbi:MAG: ABC transporter ATP-binding protein [Oscillospiraceae bacterium]|nr:ABC transporter ATP-binding protein [Oscillospiraceae bacterium]
MNLKTSFPKGVEQESVLFSLPYDLTTDGKRVNGHTCIDDSEIVIYLDGEPVKRHYIDEFSEFKCEKNYGSSSLVGIRKDGTQVCLCVFRQQEFLRYAELSKLLDFYARTGRLITETDEDEPTCEKCGIPLDGASECPFCAKKSKLFLKLIKRVAPYKMYFIIAVLCTIFEQCVWIIVPNISRLIIDDYVTPKNTDWQGLIFLSVCLVGLVAFTCIPNRINMKCSFKVALNMGKDLREEVFAKSESLSMSAVTKKTAGELIRRVSGDAAKLEDFVTTNGKDLIVDLISLVVLVVIICCMNFRLAMLVLLPIPFVFLLVDKLFHVMAKRYTRVWRNMTEHDSTLHDILNGIRVIKSYGTEVKEIRKYSDCSLKAARSSVRAEIVWYLTIPFSELIMTVGNFLVLYFGGKLIIDGGLKLGELVQFTTYVSMLYDPIRRFIHIPKQLADAAVSASKVFEVLEDKNGLKESENPVELDIKGDIEFKNVYFGYREYDPVLKDISVRINKGEMIGIVGHSGVGKSTMINLILRLYDVTGGSVLIDGTDIRELSQKSLRSQIGVVLQETFLFDGSVLENICYAKPSATFEEVIRAAKIANAHDFITKLPDGYNTRVGNKGYQLSGGERQRVAIARAILHDPKIIILDEATASLDTETEKQIQEALGRLIKGRTTIAIAHRLSTLSEADRLIVLDKGKLAEFDTHENLMRNKGVYYKLVMAQRQTTKMKKANA